jgi:hypothetical protein
MDEPGTRSGDSLRFIEEEGDLRSSGRSRDQGSSTMTQMVIKYSNGLITSERNASTVLSVFAAVFFLLAVIISWRALFASDNGGPVPPLYREDVSPELLKTLSPEDLQRIPFRPK